MATFPWCGWSRTWRILQEKLKFVLRAAHKSSFNNPHSSSRQHGAHHEASARRRERKALPRKRRVLITCALLCGWCNNTFLQRKQSARKQKHMQCWIHELKKKTSACQDHNTASWNKTHPECKSAEAKRDSQRTNCAKIKINAVSSTANIKPVSASGFINKNSHSIRFWAALWVRQESKMASAQGTSYENANLVRERRLSLYVWKLLLVIFIL